MADYSHMRGGYKPYSKSKSEPTYNGWVWDTPAKNNGYESHSRSHSHSNSPPWGKTGFANNGDGHRDHVCKPVIVDAHGRKRPIVSYSPTANHHMNGIVTKTETIVEQLRVPLVGHGSSPTKVGHMNDHGAFNNGGWHQPADSNGYNRQESYGGSYNSGSNGWNKPNGDPYFGGYQGKSQMERSQEPTVITSGGWVRPSPLGWAIPPTNETPLTKPTNDIGSAIDYLKDAVKHTPVHTPPAKPWLTVPTPTVPTIDSREARRRYASFSESPMAVKPTEGYSSAIDSREAVRRYGGQMM